MDKYQVHEWYPFGQQGRIGNPKSTAAVGAMLCSGAGLTRLPRFNFKAADIGAYSTVRYLGVLDNTVNTLRDEKHLVSRGSIWINPRRDADARLHFSFTRQRDVGLLSTGEQSLAGNPTLLPGH